MKRTFSGFLMGLPITFVIFVFMSSLISNTEAGITGIDPSDVPTIDKVKKYKNLSGKVRPPKAQLKPMEKKPKLPKIPTVVDNPIINKLNPLTKLKFPINILGTGKGPNVPGGNPGNSTGTIDNEAVPVLISEPRWPRNATTGGTVRLCFSIMPDGRASNVTITDSQPARLFDRTAKRAVYKWKFKPAYVNGKAVDQHNMCYTMNFKFEQ